MTTSPEPAHMNTTIRERSERALTMIQQWADLATDRAHVESERLRAAVDELHLLDRFPRGREGVAKLHVRVDAGAAALRDLRSDVAPHPLRDRFGMLAGLAAGRRSIDSTRNRSEPVEFEVTADKLDTGLRGFPVGTCWTSRVDPEQGVSYVGYPIADLAHLAPVSVIFLLFNKELPSDEELEAFRRDLRSRQAVDPSLIELLRQLPAAGHPMEWFCTAIQVLGMTEKTGDYKEDALNLVAKMPVVLAAIFRIREGWGEPIGPRSDLDYVENFVHMLDMPGADQKQQIRLLQVYFNLHMDHGGGNLSTFAGKAVASGLADTFQSMSSAMNGLAGPRHGRATQDCFEMVQAIGTIDPDEAEARIRARLESGDLIYGFGHAVLRQEDPRAKVEFELGEELAPDDEYFKIVKVMRHVVPKVLMENPKIQNPYPNVDFVSGTLLRAVGFTDMEYYTTLFGWSRIAGIGAQIVDERLHFRDGRGVAIYRPKYVALHQAPRVAAAT